MKTITVGQLRQNPTQALMDVEAGETYQITRHAREIARIVPPSAEPALIAPKKPGAIRLVGVDRHEVRTARTIDELLADERGAW